MTVLSFTVPGPPRGKGRPRFGRTRAGHPVAFTDEKTAAYENLVALAARQARGSAPIFDGPLAVTIRARFKPPLSSSRKVWDAMLRGEILPTKRIDVDNIVKAVLDGCNGVAWVDDVLVTDLTISKRFCAEPGVDVEIRPAPISQPATAAEALAPLLDGVVG